MTYNILLKCNLKVEEEKPEDTIPDLPENEQAREFLAKAPTKGLWMPLGKEVKVMKCKNFLTKQSFHETHLTYM